MDSTDDPTLLEQARPAQRAGDGLLLDRVRAQLFQGRGPVTVGRYRLLERLGAGGMGVVHAAYDPKLSRRVAIKLLNDAHTGRDATDAQARMLREAKAMAALSHPNVLPIYDVGEDRGGVFLAMELVDGVSLDKWLEQAQRSTEEILDVFTAAAAGLGAAHQAGLVHRDFKPANVMLDHSSHVFVMDFGLARTAASTTIDTPQESVRASDASITQTGVANGTPVYMSPQQHAGERPDPRSDQWSFGVSLYEALYRRLPFGGNTLAELRVNVVQGIEYLPRRSPAVPARVEAVVLRALRHDPAERFDSMEALVAALRPAGGRRVALGLGGGAIAAALVWVGASAPAGAPPGCAPDRSAEVWNDARRRDLRSDFHRTAEPFVKRAWPQIERRVDEYVTRWTDARGLACRLSSPALERVQACLDLRLQSLDDALSVLEQSDPEVIAKASGVVGGLPRVAECDPAVLARGQDDSVNSPEAAPVVAMLNKGRTLTTATRFREALAVLDKALLPARKLPGRTLEVRVLVAIGQAQAQDGDLDASLRTLEDAVLTAEGASQDSEALDAATEAARIAVQSGRLEQAVRWIALAHSRLEATGERGVRLVRLALVEADVAEARGEWEAAEAQARLALEEADESEPGDQGIAWVVMGRAHYRAQRWKEAESAYERAIDLLLPETGEEHPTVLGLRINIALAAIGAEEFARARDLIAPTIPALEEALGDSSLTVAMAYGNLALAHDGLGEGERSLALQRRALEIRREVLGEHPNVAMTAYNIGLQLTKRGDAQEAAAHFREAIDMLCATVGSDNHLLRGPHVRAAQANLDLGRLDDAQRHLERARELQELHGADDASSVRTTFFRARLLGARGDRDAAQRLVAQARAELLASHDPNGSFAKEMLAMIEAWEGEP